MSVKEQQRLKAEQRRVAYQEKRERKKQRREEAARRRRQAAEEGRAVPAKKTPPNVARAWESIAEERQEREQAAEEYLKAMNRHLPTLLKRMARIRDVRKAKNVTYQLSVVLLTGLLLFLLQKESRRQANREPTSAALLEALRTVFPDLVRIPHQDTVNRVLRQIELHELAAVHVDLVRRLLRKRRFARYMIENRYVIAIDGTQKASLDFLWAEQCLSKRHGDTVRYSCYVVEANLILGDGLSFPLMTEVCEYAQGNGDKQDCEHNAFKRLAERLKKVLGKKRVTVVLDGLFADGPCMSLLNKFGWQFMIVLKDDDLPAVWEEARSLRAVHDENPRDRRCTARLHWRGRDQRFWWVDNLEYAYKPSRGKEIFLTIHVVVDEESWSVCGKNDRKPVRKTSRFAWLSSEPLHRGNLNTRCNLAGRGRWTIEESILVEKRHGYQQSNMLSYDWNALMAYHLLMRMAHAVNILISLTDRIAQRIAREGQRAYIRFIERTLCGNWIDPKKMREILKKPYQVRLL